LTITATRYHDISCGHRVLGHKTKCGHAHGHNYRIHFTVVAPELDELGMVLDFGVIKSKLCEWLEVNWDHKFLLFKRDPWVETFLKIDPEGTVVVPFNPTAENMAKYLLEEVGPSVLEGCELIEVIVEETRKCSATSHK